MIVLLNGPFGIGKTAAARALVPLLPDAMVYDPEIIGAFLRRVPGPLGRAEDYQDLALWRGLTLRLATAIRRLTGRTLVVPMAIPRRDYVEEITGGWRASGARIECFRLTASPATLRARILGRPDAEGGHAWCLARLEAGLRSAADPAFGVEIETEGHTPVAIAMRITRLLAAADLDLGRGRVAAGR